MAVGRPALMARLCLRWQVRGRNVVIPLAAERRFWRVVHAVRYPRAAWYYRRMWRARPAVGQQALVHGSEVHIVTGYGAGDPDRLIFEDGSSASWMNCCEPAPLSMPRQG
jgi:hypothetical protein